MKIYKQLVMMGALCFLAALAPAAEVKKEPLPEGDLLLKHAPEYSKWTVRQVIPQQKSADAKDSPASAVMTVETLTVTKTGKIICIERQAESNNNKKYTVWMVAGRLVLVLPDGVTCLEPAKFAGASANPYYFDFTNSDFEGFEWIAPEKYTGMDNVSGVKCMVFKDGGEVARVDLKSRLPVSLENGQGAFIYNFQEAPTAVQTLPEPVKKYLADREDLLRKMDRGINAKK